MSTFLIVSSHCVSVQSHLAHSIQSAVSSRGVAHSFTSSQLQNAVTAAALGSRAGKHAAALSLQQGAKVSASSSGNQGNMGGWRKQSSGNTGISNDHHYTEEDSPRIPLQAGALRLRPARRPKRTLLRTSSQGSLSFEDHP
ncbi:hypothetical protein XENOCAPTIV_018178 [Xenoophorus captivus]|uniref:Uncharacterized protein n=1 Tax=Xenoophorus captivus TaxID=1517983 RepID=A0ABV0S2F1_9TELE